MNRLRLTLLTIFLILILILIYFLYTAYPIFKASCETAAASKSTNIMNEEVTKIMAQYTYNDLIYTQRDSTDKIVLIEANIVPINEIVSKITANIQKQIDNTPRTTVYINMGSVTGITALKNTGPKFDIELETAGNVDANLRTEFQNVGINQTLHKIYLKLKTRISIMTPFNAFGKAVETEVLLTEAIIVGDVPDTYYNLDGVSNKEDLIEVVK